MSFETTEDTWMNAAGRSASVATPALPSPASLRSCRLDRNPLANIQHTDSLAMVMVNGGLYDAATLNEVASGNRQRGRLYWEAR